MSVEYRTLQHVGELLDEGRAQSEDLAESFYFWCERVDALI